MLLPDKRANSYLQSLLTVSSHYEKYIESIILFGSYSRHEASKTSDVDVLIVLKEDKHNISNKLIRKIRFLESKFGNTDTFTNRTKNLVDSLLDYINIANGIQYVMEE